MRSFSFGLKPKTSLLWFGLVMLPLLSGCEAVEQIKKLLPESLVKMVSAGVAKGPGKGGGKPGGPGGFGGPPEVKLLEVKAENIPLEVELPGRTSPFLVAEVRPQVTGIIQERKFEEGSLVQAGQVLYSIDDASYRALHDAAKAMVAKAEANLYAAQLKRDRFAELIKSKTLSQQEFDDADAGLRQAQAELMAAKASQDKTRIDLDYTQVKAPISGYIGRSSVTPGALVTANQTLPLAKIQQLDPIYVDLNQSSTEMLRLKSEFGSGQASEIKIDHLAVQLVMEDGTLYDQPGNLAFSEVQVDETTGTLTLRARFPNAKRILLPGMYVRARLVLGERKDMIAVPHAALSRDPRGRGQVMMVNEEGKVEVRTVTTIQSRDSHWIVSSGLKSGERIIVEGLQKAQPGTQVKIAQAEPEADKNTVTIVAPNAAK
jgi:membrane fusion protein (multidrug efflux system)